VPSLPPQLDAGGLLPDVEVTGEAGLPVRLTALAADGPALLFVYKADCPATAVAGPVLPRFAQLTGLRLAAISQDEEGETGRFAAACGWTGRVRVLRDPEPWRASNALGARVTPTWILVERGGRIAAAAEGWSREDANRLAASAATLLGLAPVTVSKEGGAEPPWRPG
jgi:peroxiredoxin